MFSLLEKQLPLCQKPMIWSPLGNSLSLGFTLETICALYEYWLPREILASQSLGLMSGEFHTHASQDLACPSQGKDFANPALCLYLSLGPKTIQR